MERMTPDKFENVGIKVSAAYGLKKSKIWQEVYAGNSFAFGRGGFVSGVLLPLPADGYFEISRRVYQKFCDSMNIPYGGGHTKLAFHEAWSREVEPRLNHTSLVEFYKRYAHFLNLAEYRGEDNVDAYTIIERKIGSVASVLVPPSVGLEIVANKLIANKWLKEQQKRKGYTVNIISPSA